MRKKNFLYGFFEYILSICIILQCNSLMIVNSGIIKKSFNMFTLLLIIVLFIISFFRIFYSRSDLKDFKKLKMFSIFLFLYSIDFIIIEYFFVDKFNALTILFFLLSPIAFVTYFYDDYINNNSNYTIFSKITFITFILAIISLVGWSLILGGIKPNITFFSQWSKQNVSGYYYLDFITQYNSFLGIDNIVRNTGVFAEAPMYSYVLCISLIIQVFLKNGKRNLFDILNYIVTVVTIFSTLSTTGIIISIIIVMIDFLKTILKKYDNRVKKILVPSLVIIGLISSVFV